MQADDVSNQTCLHLILRPCHVLPSHNNMELEFERDTHVQSYLYQMSIAEAQTRIPENTPIALYHRPPPPHSGPRIFTPPISRDARAATPCLQPAGNSEQLCLPRYRGSQRLGEWDVRRQADSISSRRLR